MHAEEQFRLSMVGMGTKLQNKPFVVFGTMKGLLKFAMKLDEECNVVETSLWQLKQRFDLHLRGSTNITF